MKIDWVKKLTSRKLWLAVAGFIIGVIVTCNGDAETAEAVGGCILSLGSVVAYIIGEGLVDSAKKDDSDKE